MPRSVQRPVALVASGLASAVFLVAGGASAEPQGNLGLTVGVTGRGEDAEVWSGTAFHLGLRGDVLFGRDGVGDFGVGPYAEVLTHAFDEAQWGGGASLLLPVLDSMPLVVSAGAYARYADTQGDVQPGLASSLFWGSRSYNFTAGYVLTAGLLAQGRVGLGDAGESSIVIAAQLDTAFFALPFIFLAEAIDGGSHETDRIEPSAR